MHGLFGSGRNWFSVARQLSANWQVHALDLRNHGASQWADSMTYPEMADDVLAYLDQQSLDQVVVLGHSMGGKVAMTLADTAPERVRALIAVDIAPVFYEPTLRPFLQGMIDLDLTRVKGRRDADSALADAVPDTGIRGFLLQNLVKVDDHYKWRINLSAIDAGLERLGEALPLKTPASASFPVLSIYGEQSDYMQPQAREHMQLVFPTTEFAPIRDAGHWVHAEQAALFQQALEHFLNQL
jgi:esterase